MLDARELRVFVGLAEELHFGRAAERLGVAQSTLSVLLLRLEDVVGAPLFTRGKRAAVRLTPVGQVFIVEARQALERLERAEIIGRRAALGEAGTLDVGYVFSAMMDGSLLLLLGAIRSAAPTLTPTPRMLDTPEQIAAVAERRLDVGLCRTRPVYPAGVRSYIVRSDTFGVLIPADHRLATATKVHPADLRGETFLLPYFDERHGLLDRLDELASIGGFTLGNPTRTKDYIAAAVLALAGYGIVLGPRSLEGLNTGLRFVPLLAPWEPIQTVLIWNQAADPFVRRLHALLKHQGD